MSRIIWIAPYHHVILFTSEKGTINLHLTLLMPLSKSLWKKNIIYKKNILLQNKNLDFNLETQTLECNFRTYYAGGGFWIPEIIPCETVTCKNLTIPTGSVRNIIYNPNKKFREYQTRLNFSCPENTSLPEIVRFIVISHFLKTTVLKS